MTNIPPHESDSGLNDDDSEYVFSHENIDGHKDSRNSGGLITGLDTSINISTKIITLLISIATIASFAIFFIWSLIELFNNFFNG